MSAPVSMISSMSRTMIPFSDTGVFYDVPLPSFRALKTSVKLQKYTHLQDPPFEA